MERQYQRKIPNVRIFHEFALRFSEELYLLTCGFEQCGSDGSVGPVERSDWHLHMVLSGEGNVEAGKNTYHLKAGQMFLVKQGEKIHYYADKANPWAYCWVTFGGQNAALYMNQAGFSEGVNVVPSPVEPGKFFALINELLAHTENDLSDGLWRLGLLNQIISMITKSKCTSASETAVKPHTAADYIDYAIEYIERYYAQHIRVVDISDSIGIHRNYLTRLFKKATGLSPIEYLSHVRMNKSAQLLLTTRLPVNEVAKQVGYGNSVAFYKRFKEEFDVSPRVFRSLPENERKKLPVIERSANIFRD